MNQVKHNHTNCMMMEVDNIVKSLNIKLMEMAKLCFENNDVTLFHKDCGSLSTATLNILNACLELVDGAIVVMGMLRSIIEQQSVCPGTNFPVIEDTDNSDKFCKVDGDHRMAYMIQQKSYMDLMLIEAAASNIETSMTTNESIRIALMLIKAGTTNIWNSIKTEETKKQMQMVENKSTVDSQKNESIVLK